MGYFGNFTQKGTFSHKMGNFRQKSGIFGQNWIGIRIIVSFRKEFQIIDKNVRAKKNFTSCVHTHAELVYTDAVDAFCR